jgi:hypothetical protein
VRTLSNFRPSRRQAIRLPGLRAALALWFVAGALAGCSLPSMIDSIPTSAGGLPPETPARLETQPEYPAVNDMPRRPEAIPLTDDEQNRLRTELTTLRDRQEQLTGTAPPKKDDPAAKKKDAAGAKKDAAKKPKKPEAAAQSDPAKDDKK